MDSWNKSIEEITPAWRDVLRFLPETERVRVQEIRMRERAPLLLSLPDGLWYLRTDSRLTRDERESLVICDRRGIEDTFLRLCGYAIHAHEEELRQGFVRAGNGCRCGVAGEMATEGGEVRSFRRITGLCLRIAREHPGCATELVEKLYADGRPHGLLLCGEPASGKTSLLRDLARQLSDPVKGKGLRVAVVDERGELAGLDTLRHCDVLTGCPKPAGILQAVRCLSPDVVLFDELGGPEETAAIRQGLRCGVTVIASVHADSKAALLRRKAVRELLEDGAFSHIAVLEGRAHPCKVKELYTCEEWYRATDGAHTADFGGRRLRLPMGGAAEKASRHTGDGGVLGAVSANGVSFSYDAPDRGSGGLRRSARVPGADLSHGGGHLSGGTDGGAGHGAPATGADAGADTGGHGAVDPALHGSGHHGS